MSGFGLGTVGSHEGSPVIEDMFASQLFDEPLPYLVRGCFSMEQFEFPSPKRQRVMTTNLPRAGAGAGGAVSSSPSSLRRKSSIHSLTSCATAAAVDGSKPSPLDKAPPTSAPSAAAAGTKSKRVRTGCLTCRERHLKCDEAVPDCMNCRKSNRECKRGVRLNFIDVQVKDPPYVPPTVEWSVQFQDESRQIASEYQGGLSRYARADPNLATPARPNEMEATIRTKPSQQTPQQTRQRSRTDSQDILNLMLDGRSSSQTPTNLSSYSYTNPTPRASLSEQHSYDDGSIHARKNSEPAYLPGPSSTQSHQGGYSLQEQFNPTKLDSYSHIKEEGTSQSSGQVHHGYRNSDVSTVSSLAAATTTSSPSTSLRGPGSGLAVLTPPTQQQQHQHNQQQQQASSSSSSSDRNASTVAGGVGGEREYLNSPDELMYMQVFVEEVGVWMDSLDKDKHFSRLIPYHSLKSPMLLNAFLACGVKHLTLVNPRYQDDRALFYYDTATTQLLRSLQNPDRNTAECATTAVVLNVYEIMSEKPQQRMNHIAGARALIRECGWDARSQGVGAACFWLNIGMEVLSCLAFNWQTAWDPDQWGVDMDFSKGRQGCGGGGAEEDGDCTGRVGGEEIWVHRIFYIVARIANFRATIPKFQEASPHDEQARLGQRLRQWEELKSLCDTWNNKCPRTMHPFGYLYPSQTKSKSAFPNVWLIKRAAIIGRLFYHTAQCLLAQTHPMETANASKQHQQSPTPSRGSPQQHSSGQQQQQGPSAPSEDMRRLQLHHAHQICGIVAHSKDRGVASVAIRSLAIASSVLTERVEQDEVLEMLAKINAETGWRLGKVTSELRRAWGWEGARSGGGGLVGQVFATSSGPSSAGTGQNSSGTVSAAASEPRESPMTAQSMRGAAAGQAGQQQHSQMQQQHQQQRHSSSHAQTLSHGSLSSSSTSTQGVMVGTAPSTVVAPAPMKAPVNPLSFADFSLPNHPYQNWYEPPNRNGSFNQAF